MKKNSKFILAASLLMAGSMWFYVQHVLILHQQVEAAINGTPRGNLSDLYPRWLGARELLFHHRDPYSPEITREIQIGYYGRALDPTRPQDPKDQQGFAYPLYVVFLLAPTVGFSFSIVQAGFCWFLVALTGATVLLWLRAMRWKPSCVTIATLTVLALGSFPVLQGIKLQQLSLLVAGLVAACALALVRNCFALAGILLALATIKPQLVLPVIAWLLFWAFSDWRHRQNFVWGFTSALAVLFVATEYWLPGWIWRFREAVIAYRQYNDGAGSVLDLMVGSGWAYLLAALAVVTLGFMGCKLRHVGVDSPVLTLMLALVLAVTVVIAPKAAPYNQVLLLPGILMVAHDWRAIWKKGSAIRAIFAASCLVVSWPWLAASALTIASLFLPAIRVQQGWAVPLWTSLAIPLCVALLLACTFRDLAKPGIGD